MHIIETDKIKRYIPADLSECDSQQYIDMCDLLFKFHTQQISSEEMLTHAVYKLMNMKPSESKDEASQLNKLGNIALIQEMIEESFFEKIEIEDSEAYDLKIIQNYVDNPVPKFKPLWRTYYGPDEMFNNVKIGEYTDALKLFLKFNATSDMDTLYEFVATLYRPKKPFYFISKHLSSYDGDCRVKYNPNHIQKRVKALKYAPIGFIYGVYLYFASVQIIISSGQIEWGDKTLDLSILFKGDNATIDIEAEDIGLDSIVFAMAESGAFGDYTKVKDSPFWDMMIKMYDSRIKQLQQQKLEEDAKSQQPS
jgi:hypothetical protein